MFCCILTPWSFLSRLHIIVRISRGAFLRFSDRNSDLLLFSLFSLKTLEPRAQTAAFFTIFSNAELRRDTPNGCRFTVPTFLPPRSSRAFPLRRYHQRGLPQTRLCTIVKTLFLSYSSLHGLVLQKQQGVVRLLSNGTLPCSPPWNGYTGTPPYTPMVSCSDFSSFRTCSPPLEFRVPFLAMILLRFRGVYPYSIAPTFCTSSSG